MCTGGRGAGLLLNCCAFFPTAEKVKLVEVFARSLKKTRKNPRDLGSQFAKGGADLFV